MLSTTCTLCGRAFFVATEAEAEAEIRRCSYHPAWGSRYCYLTLEPAALERFGHHACSGCDSPAARCLEAHDAGRKCCPDCKHTEAESGEHLPGL